MGLRKSCRSDVALCWVFFFGSLYLFAPGLMSYDSHLQFEQALTGVFSDWHPPIMALVWRALLPLSRGPFPMLVFHNAMFWAGLGLCTSYAFRRPLHSSIALLLMGLFPPVVTQLGVIWKDTGLAASLILAVGLLLHGSRSARPAAYLAFSLVALFYATALRHNAVFAVAPLLVWWAQLALRGATGRTACWVGLGLSFAMLLGSVLLTLVLVPQKQRTYPSQEIRFFNLAAISVKTGKLLFPEYILHQKNRTLRLADIEATYTPDDTTRLCDVVPETRDPAELRELNRVWLAAIWSHPLAYLSVRTDYMLGLLAIGRPEVCYAYHDTITVNSRGLAFHANSAFDAWIRVVAALQHTAMFRGYLYLLVSLILVVFATRRSTRSLEVVCLAASGVIYNLSYFVAGPACSFRYLYWTVDATLLALLIWVARAVGVPHRPTRDLRAESFSV